jgi:hypothetical protein
MDAKVKVAVGIDGYRAAVLAHNEAHEELARQQAELSRTLWAVYGERAVEGVVRGGHLYRVTVKEEDGKRGLLVTEVKFEVVP